MDSIFEFQSGNRKMYVPTFTLLTLRIAIRITSIFILTDDDKVLFEKWTLVLLFLDRKTIPSSYVMISGKKFVSSTPQRPIFS